jgi:hypothetical protein
MTTHWTLGVLIGLPFAILGAVLLLAGVAWAVWMLRHEPTDPYDGHILHWVLFACTGLGLLGLVIGCLFGYWPYKAEYHQWRHHGGDISALGQRFVGNGDGGTDQKFVVSFKGNPQQYACNDTRCALLHVGDHLDLSCLRKYVYSSTSGYDCNYVASRKAS